MAIALSLRSCASSAVDAFSLHIRLQQNISLKSMATATMPANKERARKRALQKGGVAVKNERGEYTGIYTPNKEELKQVEWIMSSFLRVDRYKVLIDLCKSKGIKTKQGKHFTKHSLRTLLTNPRYIGKWYRNRKNAGKRQNKLMPYERFTEVELTHGCVIDKRLWQQVQDKVKELDNSRAQFHSALGRFLAPDIAFPSLA